MKRVLARFGPSRRGRSFVLSGIALAASIAITIPAAAGALEGSARSSARVARDLRSVKDVHATKDAWRQGARSVARGKGGDPIVSPSDGSSFTLDRADLRAALAQAPREGTDAARLHPLVLSLPAPDGSFQRFAVQESPIMESALAREHPEIATYSGRGIDDLAATIRLDLSPLGFHASVRSPDGNWYIDPHFRGDQTNYISYLASDLTESQHGTFVFRDPDEEEAALSALSDLTTHGGGPKAGATLRTYRLGLVSDPSYATYFGAGNVTAAKVALMNRVDQIYEDETSIRMILIGNNDLLNLDTAALATDPNGPCGSAACFTTAQLAGGCTGGLLSRNRIVVGQIIGASNYDIGHIVLGINGGGVASLGVVGGNSKAQGCTGLPQPDGDFFAVDYVAHEMGHEFAGNHTFNGNQLNCSGGNRNGGTSVEPGSGSSIMAYAGICRQDDLQPHSDPYWSQRSFEEITNYTSATRPPINEVQTASLRDFDGTDSFTITYNGSDTVPIVNGSNYSAAGIQAALQGVSEVQTVSLSGHDANGDSYTLSYNGADTAPIVRGQNNTAAGIQNALQGGNEQQQVVLTGFSGATQSFQVQIGGNTSAVLGAGGLTVSNANVAAAVNAIPGFAGTVTSAGAGNGGFTLSFGGASANTDVPSIAIVNCTGACVASVRETAKGGTAVAGWPAGGTVAVGAVADTGYTLTFGGAHQGTDVSLLAVTNGNGASGSIAETTKGSPGMLPIGATATVAGFGGGAFNTTGFQVTFGGSLGLVNVSPLTLTNLNGATGFFGETAKGGPIDNQGFTATPTGNSPPDVVTPEAYTIPYRTPFSLTGGATDPDGDTLTYLWEQNDIGATAIALVNPSKTSGPLFRQFGTALNAALYDPHQYNALGENHVTTDPTRVFPDLAQILAGNTNAATGDCPGAPAPPPPASGGTNVPQPLIDCYSEFLPTSVYAGPMHFRLTARDGHPSGGGVASSDTVISLAPGTGPFRVTSQASPATYEGGSLQTVTWDPAGSNLPPIDTANVKISLSTDGGFTYPYVLASSTPNDGSEAVAIANVATSTARIKVEAVGNVFFDISDADVAIVGVPDVTNDAPGGVAGVQYSDALSPTVTVTATDPDTAGSALTAVASGLPTGLSLVDGSTSAGSALPGTHTWTVAGTVTAAPGSYPVTVTVTDDAGHSTPTSFTIQVLAEDADAAYTGDSLAYPPPAGTSATLLLRANVRDAVDAAPGDIRNATVTFREGGTTLCGPLPVALLGGATTVGTASCSAALSIGAHSIDVVVDGFYTVTRTEVVNVKAPIKTRISADGELAMLAPAGAYTPDLNSILKFNLDVTYKNDRRAAKNIAGSVELVFDVGVKTYRVNATAFTSLGAVELTPGQGTCVGDPRDACVELGDLRATAKLTDITKKKAVVVADDLTLRITGVDGHTWRPDTIGVTLWDGNTLLFASRWNGVATVEQTVTRGHVDVDRG